MLSVVIITFNEEDKIEACLESVAWVDEIVVVDSFSTDRTLEIARRFTDRIYQRKFTGYGEQKAYATQQAKGDWILSLDADERVTEALRDEICRTLPGANVSGFYMLRDYYFPNGRKMHRGLKPNYVLRLFRRDKGWFVDRLVHEAVGVTGSTAKLRYPIEHHPRYSMSTLIRKADAYSTLGAQAMAASGKRCTCFSAWGHSISAFFMTYVARLGFLDGFWGLATAYSDATYAFYKYMKCIELQKQEEP